MPRYKTTKRYQVGDYWLSKQSRSPAWCRTWYCNRSKQTRRSSLLTADFSEAKDALNQWFILECQKKDQASYEVTIAAIFARYYEKHGQHLSSYDSVKRNLSFWLDYHGEATLEEAADLRQQEIFRDYLQTERNLGLNSVRKVITIGKAAVNWAYKRGEIQQVPYFEMVKVPKSEPMGRHLEISEIASLFLAADKQHMKLFILMLIGTAARPKAVLDLQYGQIDFARDIIDLNSIGRFQTTKNRPMVKLPKTLKSLLKKEQKLHGNPYVIHFNDQPIKSTKSAWTSLRKASGLEGKVTPYSIRRSMARFMRTQGVPAWEVAEQLGHKSTGYRITELYTSHSPDYLEKAAESIDVFFGQLTCELRVSDLSEIFDGT